ncbi:spiro-SPASM protein [Leptonema illini]|uniref:4Fe4S-binding SPASM domain-containing protein n=1 Tax=Leptonema illini DSM 21528 TaxID=929563 RepID=H2CFR7_9LEPT|nr:spiro-SPASM protein [Leptonema illini]EHQ06766.1 hypothetical protein Lepil_2086 [Leptonema illini DSM 21528]
MTNRVILCLETPPVLHEELLASSVRRLGDFIHALSNKPELDILCNVSAASQAERLATAINEKIGPVNVRSYSGPIAIALHGCISADEVAVVFPGIVPFLDVRQGMQMLERHLKFRTHYSYSDTAVPGFLFDIVSGDLFTDMPPEGMQQPTIEALRAFCFRNIQDVDIDLHYATPDLRAYRLRLDCLDARSADRALRVYRKYPDLVHEQLSDVVRSEADLCGRQPSYLEIELTTEQAVQPTVYPTTEKHSLDEEQASLILKSLRAFRLENDVTVCLGGRGDPFAYAGLDDFVAALSAIDVVKALYIETPGVGLTRSRLDSLVAAWNLSERSGGSQRSPSLMTLIVRLPSLKQAQYRRWMGVDRLNDVLSFLDSICANPVAINVCAEMIRLPENEEELDGFMKRFPADKVRPLIGKYSRFGDALPALDVVDLSPLNRDYCRHLAFDFFINAKGEMPVCRQKLSGGPTLRESDLLSVFESRRNLHLSWMKGEYESVLPQCASCDDWYFFNA